MSQPISPLQQQLTLQQLSLIATGMLPPPTTHIPIKNKGPKAFSGKEGTLKKFLFQMDEYLRLYKSVDEEDKLSVLTLSLEGSVLDWWYKRWVHITTWEGAKKASLSQCSDNFIEDNSQSKLEELQQTGQIQFYLGGVEQLNGHANLSEEVIIALIYRKIKLKLKEMMAPFHAIQKTEPKAWINMLISCGESME